MELFASIAEWGGKKSPFSTSVVIEQSKLIPATH